MTADLFIKINSSSKIKKAMLELRKLIFTVMYTNIKELEQSKNIDSELSKIPVLLEDIDNYIDEIKRLLPDEKEIKELEKQYKELLKIDDKENENKMDDGNLNIELLENIEGKKKNNKKGKKEKNVKQNDDNKSKEIKDELEYIEKELKEIDEELSKIT